MQRIEGRFASSSGRFGFVLELSRTRPDEFENPFPEARAEGLVMNAGRVSKGAVLYFPHERICA